MTIDKPSKTEKLRAFLRKPYVRIPLILVVLLYAGFVVVLIFVAIASLYTLGTLVGIPTIQLVIGTVSAMGTLTSAGVAYLLYRSSVRGAEISVALEDLLEADMEYRVRKTLASNAPPGTTQELGERLHFAFPLVWLNSGPRGGAITNVALKLMKPDSRFPTVRDGEASEDEVSVGWIMNITKPEERIELNSVRLPLFSGGLQNSMSIGNNESVAVVVEVDLFLMDKQKDVRPPMNSWMKIQQDTPYFEFKLSWKTASKDRLRSSERSFKVRPKFGEPIQEGPAAVLS